MSNIFSIGFYNLENLFDPLDIETSLDKDYTPNGKFKWDREKYNQKIMHLSGVISKMGLLRSEKPPVLLGVCEVENENCLHDLITSDQLKNFNYNYVFHQSADPRGMHVAFLYQSTYFTVADYKAESLDAEGESETDHTRDILHISGDFLGHKIHLLLNHWPSRTDGTKKTNYKRMNASKKVQKIITEIKKNEVEANIVIMGDFNDDPTSQSMLGYSSNGFINPMEEFQKQKKGSVKYKGKWMMFDQILFNRTLYEASWFKYLSAQIFVEPTLVQKSGRHKGSPKRTFNGSYHQGGYSDHFPVFIYFENTPD